MPTHALLGATGSTGAAVLKYLLDEPPADLTLNIFVRNKSKLLKAFADLERTTAIKVKITEANTDDIEALKSCLEDADVIYNCISTNDAGPGVSVSREIATSIIASLRAVKAEQRTTYKPPTVIINRSATLNAELRKSAGLAGGFVHFALGNCYYDIEQACNMYEAESKKDRLLDYIFADPPALHASPNTGRTGHEFIFEGQQGGSLSYADLGASIVDLALHKEQYIGKGVGIQATGKVDENWPLLISYISRGLRARILQF